MKFPEQTNVVLTACRAGEPPMLVEYARIQATPRAVPLLSTLVIL